MPYRRPPTRYQIRTRRNLGPDFTDPPDCPDCAGLFTPYIRLQTFDEERMSQASTASAARAHDRVATRLRVTYGVGAVDSASHAESISEGGLYINTNDVFKVGSRLIVRIEFPERAVCHCAEVTWAIRVPDHLRDQMVCGMGVSFIDPDPQWPEFFRRWQKG